MKEGENTDEYVFFLDMARHFKAIVLFKPCKRWSQNSLFSYS